MPNKNDDKDTAVKGDSKESDDDNDSDEMTSLSLGKPFQRLQFLVRDSTEIEDFDVDANEEVQNAQYEVSSYECSVYVSYSCTCVLWRVNFL